MVTPTARDEADSLPWRVTICEGITGTVVALQDVWAIDPEDAHSQGQAYLERLELHGLYTVNVEPLA